MKTDSANRLQEMRLRMIIAKLRRLIPYTILVQNSKILYIKNKKFFPIIFFTRNDYYTMIITTMYKIVYYFKTTAGKKFIKNLIQHKCQLRIIISQSGKIIFQIKKF